MQFGINTQLSTRIFIYISKTKMLLIKNLLYTEWTTALLVKDKTSKTMFEKAEVPDDYLAVM